MKNNIKRFLGVMLLCIAFCCLYACGEKPQYTAVFEWNNGDEATIVTVAEGENPSVPQPPVRLGYTFLGWFSDAALTAPATPDAVALSENVTYYAAWTPHSSVRVTFDGKGAASAPAPIVLHNGAVLRADAITAPEKPGYTFAGWYSDAKCLYSFDFSIAPTKNVTLYAKWNLNADMAETIGYVNGEEIGRVAFAKGLPMLPVEDGEVCYLWFTDKAMRTPFDATVAVDGSVTLYGVPYTPGVIVEDGVVTGYTGTSSKVYVPMIADGKYVERIAPACFADNTAIREVILPTTIVSVGEKAFYGCTSLTSVNLTAACTTLGAYAFYRCEKIASVGDVSSLHSIPDAAFLGCERLTTLNVSDTLASVGAYAFADCAKLSSVILPDSVSAIGDYAFSGCRSFEEFYVPASLSLFGVGALNGCDSLTKISHSDNNSSSFYRVIDGNLYSANGKRLLFYLGAGKTEEVFVIPEEVTTISEYAFYGCNNIKELDVSNPNIVVKKSALAGMRALEKLTIRTLGGESDYLAYYFGANKPTDNGSNGVYTPASLKTVVLVEPPKTLRDHAFYGVSGLQTVEGLQNLQSIGKYALAHTAIREMVIPKTLTAIGENAFFGCSYIEKFTVAEDNLAYVSYDGCLYNKQMTALYLVPQSKTEIVFPETLKTIYSGSFYKSHVKTLTLPMSVQEIQAGAFLGMLSVEEMTVPFIGGKKDENRYMLYVFGGTMTSTLNVDGTTSYSTGNTNCTPPTLKKLTVLGELQDVPDFAFAYLNGLTEVVLNGTITGIGAYAYCMTGFETLTIPSTVTRIDEYAFASMNNLIAVTVPGSVGSSLGEGLFYSCSDLETVVFEEGVLRIPNNALFPTSNGTDEDGVRMYSSVLKSVSIPASCLEIGENAFAYAGVRYVGEYGSSYEDIRITIADGANLTTIENAAFYRAGISSISLPATVKTIGEMAFFDCKKLTSVSFGNAEDGSQLEKIGGAAFVKCIVLEKVYIYKDVASVEDVPVLEGYIVSTTTENEQYDVFDGTSDPSIYVRSAASYRKAENWSKYDKQIFELA